MKRILVLSDTHIQMFKELPLALKEIARNFDLIIHAGDICSLDVLNGLQILNKVIAVQGNMDDSNVKGVLQVEERFEIEGVRFGLTHGYGAPNMVPDNVVDSFRDVNVLIFGHSHIPFNEERNGCVLFNPGSCTDPRSAIIPTYGIIEVKDGDAKLFIHQLTDA